MKFLTYLRTKIVRFSYNNTLSLLLLYFIVLYISSSWKGRGGGSVSSAPSSPLPPFHLSEDAIFHSVQLTIGVSGGVPHQEKILKGQTFEGQLFSLLSVSCYTHSNIWSDSTELT